MTLALLRLAATKTPLRARVLFIHGMDSSAATWSGVLDRLRAAGDVDACAVSLPGHGASALASEDELVLSSLFAQLDGVLDDVFGSDARVVVVGHSAGARVAIPFAASRRSRVSGLMVEDMHVDAYTPPTAVDDAGVLARVRAFPQTAASFDEAAALYAPFGFPRDRVAVWAQDDRIVAQADGTLDLRLRPLSQHLVMHHLLANDASERVFGSLSDMAVSVVLADRNGTVVRDEASVRKMRDLLPSAKYVVVPKSGHSVHKTNVDEFMGELDDLLARA